MFLPQREGGIDNGQRLADYAQSRIPTIQVIANWAPFKITEGLLSRPAWMSLLRLNDDLFNKYDIQPREMYLRGHRDAMVRRLDRMELFVDSPALTGLERDALEIVDWLNKVNTAFAAIQFDDPKQQGSAQKAMAAMFGDDTFVGRLIQVDKDEQFNREAKGQEQVKRGVMTKILAIGSRDYFAAELARLRASANHELAERSQATADAAKSMNASRNRADEAWGNAKSAWANYYLVTSLSGKIDRGVQQIHRWQDLERLGVRLGLLEALHLDVHKYFQAKIRLAECKLHADTNGAKSAASYLEETRREIEAMESKAFLKSEVEALTQSLRQFPKGEEPLRTRLQRRVDLLATDWSATGNYHWLNKQIDRRIALQK
jgi:hypothetical protein